MKKLSSSLATVAAIGIFLSLTTIVFAWQKDGEITCQNVFAKIKNDNHYRYSDSSDGYVKYVRTETDNDGNSDWEWRVGPIEGDVSNNAWVEVSWTPPAGFSGDVEVLVAIYEDKDPQNQTWNDNGDFEDSKKVTKHLNCPGPSPSPSPTYQPSPSLSPSLYPSPSPSPSPTPQNDPSPSPSTESSPSPSPNGECDGLCDNTGGNPSPTPDPSPEASPSPTSDPSPSYGGSESNSSPSNNNSQGSSSQGGQVLGTSTGPTTLASTGTTQNYLIFLLGISLITLGVFTLRRKPVFN